MCRLKSTICALLVACTLRDAAAALRSTPTVSRSLPAGDLFLQADSVQNTTVTYASCDKSSVFDRQKDRKNCTIYLESLSFAGSPSSTWCNVTVSVSKKGNIIFYDHQVYLLGRDKSVLVSYEVDNKTTTYSKEALVRFTIVHHQQQQDHCLSYEASVTIGVYYVYFTKLRTQLVTYDDSFDAAFYKYGSCNGRYCRASFDSRGRRLGGPVPWFNFHQDGAYNPDLYTVQPVQRDSSAGGYLITTRRKVGDANTHTQDVNAFLFKDDEVKLLKRHSGLRSFLTLAQSTANGAIGLCASHISEVTSYVSVDCSQSDHEGAPLLETSRSVLLENGAMAMGNARGGGLLLVTRACARESCDSRGYDYRVTRYAADGRRVGALAIDGRWRCSSSELSTSFQFYESERGEVCLSFLCASQENASPEHRRLDFAAVCFDSEDVQ